MEDYTPVEGSGGISLKAGDQIEVLHCEGEELWLGRTLSIKKRCGWVGLCLYRAPLLSTLLLHTLDYSNTVPLVP